MKEWKSLADSVYSIQIYVYMQTHMGDFIGTITGKNSSGSSCLTFSPFGALDSRGI